jgi:hypothetical protein
MPVPTLIYGNETWTTTERPKSDTKSKDEVSLICHRFSLTEREVTI